MNDDSRLSPEAHAVIDAARSGARLTPVERARIRRGIDARLGLAALAPGGAAAKGAVASQATTHAVGLLGASTAAKVAVLVVAAAAVGGGAHAALRARHAPPPISDAPTHAHHRVAANARTAREHPSPTTQPVAALRSAPLPPPVEYELPRPVAPLAPAAPSLRVRRADPSPAAAPAVNESAILGRAITLERAGQRAEALALLELNAGRFGSGALRHERDALHAILLCESGRGSEARDEADAVLGAAPDSPFAARLRRACGARRDASGVP